MPEPVGVVPGLDDMAVVGQPIQQRRGHLGVDEDVGPLGKDQVGRDHHAGVLVELGQQVEQQRPAGLAEGQVAQLVQDHQVQVQQLVGQAAGLAGRLLLLQGIYQLDRAEEPNPLAVPAHRLHAQGRGQVRLAAAGDVPPPSVAVGFRVRG